MIPETNKGQAQLYRIDPETNKGQAQLYRIDQPGKRLCRHLEMSNDIISLKISV